MRKQPNPDPPAKAVKPPPPPAPPKKVRIMQSARVRLINVHVEFAMEEVNNGKI